MFFISISLVSAQEIDNDFIIEQNNETGSFSELQINIDSIEDSGNLNLSKDYKADSLKRMVITKSINIDGNDHVLNGLNQSAIFRVFDSDVVLRNINFINGFSEDYTFGIDLNNANVKIINCTFSYNLGAISLMDSNLTISKSTFSFNEPMGMYTCGGAIYAVDSILYVDESVFYNNSASAGGAICCFNTNSTIINSDFYNNNVTFYGGAIFSDSPLTITDSRLYKNNAGYKGGAVHTTSSYKNEDSSLYIDNCDLFNNVAEYGGVVSSSNINFVIINNSRIHDNSALIGAVVLIFSRNTVKIINSLCYNNVATNGSIVYSLAGGNIYFLDSDFKNNAAEFGALSYSLFGRVGKEFVNFNLSVINSNLTDNICSKGLIYSILGNVIVYNSSITYKNQSYDTPVIYKVVEGNVTQKDNWWGVENPDLDKLIVFDFDLFSSNISEDVNQSDDCASSVIQIDDENFVFTFRRDSSYQLCVDIVHQDEGILQYKCDSSYFIHSFIGDNGWVFGSGGLDSPFASEMAEAFAKIMSRNNMIIDELMLILFDIKLYERVGHFFVKSPNGTYALLSLNSNSEMYIFEKGILQPGEFLIIPNDPNYLRKGNVSDLNVSDYVFASRYIAALDGYGVARTNEFTYNFVTDEFNEKYVDIYVANDDGSLSNRSNTSAHFNDVFITDNYVFGEDVPIIMDGMYLGRMIINESNLKINAQDIIKYYGGPERFVVSLTDFESNPFVNKTVIIDINGVSYSRTTDENGTVSIAIGLNSGVYDVVVRVGNKTVNSVVTILSTVNGTNIAKVYRNDTQYYATFLDSDGIYLKDGETVRFNINGVMYDRKIAGDEGLAKLNINLEQGQYVITAINLVTGEKTANNITVIPRIIENNDIIKYYRNGTQYTVKILGGDGNPVGAGENVTFNINGVFYTRQTDENGIAKLNINLLSGNYIVTAECKGCVVSNNIKVLSVLNANDITMKYGDGTQFKVNLVDGRGNPYADQSVAFNINGMFYNRMTDSNGQAKLNINLMPDEYIITSSYYGSSIANKITIES